MNKLKSQEGCKMLSCYDKLVKLRIVNQGTWEIDGKRYTQKSLRGGGIDLPDQKQFLLLLCLPAPVTSHTPCDVLVMREHVLASSSIRRTV